jgi:hypothetical protein
VFKSGSQGVGYYLDVDDKVAPKKSAERAFVASNTLSRLMLGSITFRIDASKAGTPQYPHSTPSMTEFP